MLCIPVTINIKEAMNLEEKIKKEIYEYVTKFKLSESELNEIDNYVLSLMQDFKVLINTHDSILGDKNKLDKLKKVVKENLEESKIV
jgi:hypothetical protein